jgi:hypothetical protein
VHCHEAIIVITMTWPLTGACETLALPRSQGQIWHTHDSRYGSSHLAVR